MILDLLSQEYENTEKRDYIGISQSGYCSLKVVRQVIRKEKTELKPEVLGKFFRGQALHNEIPSLIWRNRKYFREKYGLKYLKAEKEVSIKIENEELKGHLDLLFENQEGNLIVFDWKVVNFIPSEPHQHYLDQLYMYATAIETNKVALVYFDSENMKERLFERLVDPERVEFLKKKYLEMMQSIKSNQEPEKPFQAFDESWECSYCQYKYECWSKDEIEKIYQKKFETKLIPENLTNEYLAIYKQYKETSNKKSELEEQIKDLLAGADGIGSGLSVKYIQTAPKEDYDIEAIKKVYDIEKFKILKQSKPYYKFTVKE